MSMDEILQVFSEESKELLENMEDSLLQLEADPGNDDLVNELFRAVHTIKGSSGIFGFDNVVEFTHLVESVMGRIRDHEIELANALLTLLLESRDHISSLVDLALRDNAVLDQDTIETGQSLTGQLNQYLSPDPDPERQQQHQTDKTEIDPILNDASSVENKYWHISLRFGKDVLRNGMEPLSFIRYLETIGDIANLTTLDDNFPDFKEMDAESCYLGFEIDLYSEADKNEIESVFEFVQDDCVIHILPPHSLVSSYIQLIEELPEENFRIGEILVCTGALTDRELGEILDEQKKQRGENDETDDSKPQSFGEVAVQQGVIEQPVVTAAVNKQQQVKEQKEQENQLVRVSAAKLEELINLVGELVISGANTYLLARRSGDGQLTDATETLSGLVENIRDTALSLRMVQIGTTFNRFRRVVREVSRELGKEIDLVISGGDTELDKTVVDKIGDPLMHLVRNAIDHGIESPQERQLSGKPVNGVVHLNAYHDSGSIVIEISDDGKGLSKEKILAKALEKQLIKENHSLTDSEIYRLIFEPGFSTADQVSNLSGRGVGMDVVRRNIDALRGQVDIDSNPGDGSKISIRLPLTLAIIDGFLVQVGKSSYVIPLDMVDECVEYGEVSDASYEDSQHINLRGEILPYVRLRNIFCSETRVDQNSGSKRIRENIVVARYAGHKAGLVVDDLLGEHQTVIKPLGTVFQNVDGLSGATILGSGEVAMIVDVPALVGKVSETISQNDRGNNVRPMTEH